METFDSEEPLFLWWNTTGMLFRTHCAPEHKGKSNGQGEHADVMVAHDEYVGTMLDKLDELGIADNTIVMYSTDNAVHFNSWMDAGVTPFRSERTPTGRVAGAFRASCVGQAKSRQGLCSTESFRTRISCPRCWQRPGSPRSPRNARGPSGGREGINGPHRR